MRLEQEGPLYEAPTTQDNSGLLKVDVQEKPQYSYTPTENAILDFLITSPGEATTTRQDIANHLKAATGNDYTLNTVSVHLKRLRQKIGFISGEKIAKSPNGDFLVVNQEYEVEKPIFTKLEKEVLSVYEAHGVLTAQQVINYMLTTYGKSLTPDVLKAVVYKIQRKSPTAAVLIQRQREGKQQPKLTAVGERILEQLPLDGYISWDDLQQMCQKPTESLKALNRFLALSGEIVIESSERGRIFHRTTIDEGKKIEEQVKRRRDAAVLKIETPAFFETQGYFHEDMSTLGIHDAMSDLELLAELGSYNGDKEVDGRGKTFRLHTKRTHLVYTRKDYAGKTVGYVRVRERF